MSLSQWKPGFNSRYWAMLLIILQEEINIFFINSSKRLRTHNLRAYNQMLSISHLPHRPQYLIIRKYIEKNKKIQYEYFNSL